MTLIDLIKRTGQSEPYAKYVLLRLAFRAWDGVSIEEPSKNLVASFGITYSQFVEAKTALLEAGLLCEEVVKTADSSKPSRKLVWPPQRTTDTMASLVSCINHAHAVNAVLNLRTRINKARDIGQPELANKGKQLAKARAVQPITTINCLLLAVMWLLADKFGVVEKVGTKELAALTGLDRDSVKYRVQKLVQMGFIRMVVKGGYSEILGGRIKTIYVLNAQHNSLAAVKGLPSCFDLSASTLFNGRVKYWPWTYQEHQSVVKAFSIDPESFTSSIYGRYHWVLHRTESEVYFRHIAQHVAGYTALLLSNDAAVTNTAKRNLFFPEILRDFKAPKHGDGVLWASVCKGLKLKEPEVLVVSEPGEIQVVPERSPELTEVMISFVSIMLKSIQKLMKSQGISFSSARWRHSRIFCPYYINGNEGVIVLSTTS